MQTCFSKKNSGLITDGQNRFRDWWETPDLWPELIDSLLLPEDFMNVGSNDNDKKNHGIVWDLFFCVAERLSWNLLVRWNKIQDTDLPLCFIMGAKRITPRQFNMSP